MTPRELAELRDRVVRGRLDIAAPAKSEAEAEPAVKDAPLGLPRIYPVPGPASILECPWHRLTVALDADGRIASACPDCQREVAAAMERMGWTP